MQAPAGFEQLEGGDPARLGHHLHHPALLGAIVVLAVLAGAGLLVARPWQAGPTPAAQPSPSPTIDVQVVSTGSTGTVLPVAEAGYGAARMEMRVDLVSGDEGRVLGMVGPGVVQPSASGPALAPGTSSIALVGARFECAQVAGADPSEYGLAVRVSLGGTSAQVVRPLPGLDGPTWLGLVTSACAGPTASPATSG